MNEEYFRWCLNRLNTISDEEVIKLAAKHGFIMNSKKILMENVMMSNLKMYIAVLDEFPDYMTPTLVAHAVLAAHELFAYNKYNQRGNPECPNYWDWFSNSFKKCVVRVNQKEFDKITALENVYLGHENNTLEGRKACAVVCPREETPNVLKFAKLWKPAILV